MPRMSILIAMLALSCSSKNDPLQAEMWELNSIYSYMSQTGQEASELNYTERVEFVANGDFLKLQIREGETTILDGRWILFEQDGRSGYRITYSEDHPFVRNCTVEPVEFYYLAQGILIQSDFTPCDGPEYRYVRVAE